MTTQAKSLILSAVAQRQTLGYRAKDIVEETGLSRQLVQYHMDQFVNSGYVEKRGIVYFNQDLPGLIKLLATGLGPSNDIDSTVLFPKKQTDALKNSVAAVRLARAMRYPDSFELKNALNADITETVKSLENAKRTLNKEIAEHTVRQLFKDPDDFVEAYVAICIALNHKVDKEAVLLAALDFLERS